MEVLWQSAVDDKGRGARLLRFIGDASHGVHFVIHNPRGVFGNGDPDTMDVKLSANSAESWARLLKRNTTSNHTITDPFSSLNLSVDFSDRRAEEPILTISVFDTTDSENSHSVGMDWTKVDINGFRDAAKAAFPSIEIGPNL